MSHIDQVNSEDLDVLLKEYLERLKSQIGPMIGGDMTARRALAMALGGRGGGRSFGGVGQGQGAGAL